MNAIRPPRITYGNPSGARSRHRPNFYISPKFDSSRRSGRKHFTYQESWGIESDIRVHLCVAAIEVGPPGKTAFGQHVGIQIRELRFVRHKMASIPRSRGHIPTFQLQRKRSSD